MAELSGSCRRLARGMMEPGSAFAAAVTRFSVPARSTTPDLLSQSLREFLAEAGGLVIEEGRVILDLESARYSVSTDRGRCLLHLWSEERNLVREVLEAEIKPGLLTLSVRGFAQARQHRLEIVRDRGRTRSFASKDIRHRYARLLEHVLRRQIPDWALGKAGLTTSMSLERSFSPVYARGLLRKGLSGVAVLGVNRQESQAAIDGALTFGLIWLEACREREAGRCRLEGLKLIVPPGSSDTLRIRLAHLRRSVARFELLELDENDESLREIDFSDYGNIDTRLSRCPDEAHVRSRFAAAIARVAAILPQAETSVLSASEIAFRRYGLEFARVRLVNLPGTFAVEEQFLFGPPGLETRLTAETEAAFIELARALSAVRDSQGDRRSPWWRMYPERWLESLVFKDVSTVDARLQRSPVYSQVPAFSASDRAMIDVLACTRERRLAVVELKADEDIHLPLQGLDYWARVLWHHRRGELQRYGYFAGLELSPRPPLLFLVAPALRVHPAADCVLRYFSPEIEWTLTGVDERWRNGIKVVFRKSRAEEAGASAG